MNIETQLYLKQQCEVAQIVKMFMKVKGDMLVMENISRKKNKIYFEKLEKFLKGE